MLTKSEQKFIQTQLTNLGCKDLEISVYLCSLESGASSIQALASALSQNRVTVHSSANRLIEKGLLFESFHGKKRLLIAENPGTLRNLIKIKEQELEQSKGNLDYAINLLQKLQASTSTKTKVEHYEGTLGLKKMIELSLSAKGEFLGIVDVERFAGALGSDYLENFFKKRSEKGIKSRLIWPEKGDFYKRTLPKAKDYKVQIKLLAFKNDWRSALFSWNNNIAMCSFSPKTISCTIIQADDISYFFREVLFEVIWNTARTF
jgi:sugar-specific transcriptional regulator TrmB